MIVALLHALVWRELSQVDLPGSTQPETSTRLRLTWIERESPRIIDAPRTISPPPPRTPRMASDANVESHREVSDIPSEAIHAPPQPTRSLSAVFLEQGRRHAEQIAHAERLPADPFASRTGGFERPAPDTIRMKPPLSPQAIVAAVGQYLFAPPGYEQDPCPQNARNIRRLMDGSDPKAMQHELDYEREYCRP
ncbi:MAG: hypothetical protein M3R16_13160 [Pseudomonadota bacterium]|nr:hypothetical protein [Pseudomonadota bacterium]